MQFSPLEHLLGATTPSVLAGMLRFTVAVVWYSGTVTLFRAFLVAMATPAPETSCGLLTVDPYVAEVLAVLTLCETTLDFVCFELYNDVMEDGKGEC
jgi:hypothetical protein